MKRRLLTALASIVGLLITIVLVTASIWPVINSVETGHTGAYPDVSPQFFSADPKRVFGESAAAVEGLDRWAVTEKDPGAGIIRATRDSTLTQDEIRIKVVSQTDFVTRIDVLSTSPQARGDFGQNARNIRELQAAIDDRLGAVRFDPWSAEKK